MYEPFAVLRQRLMKEMDMSRELEDEEVLLLIDRIILDRDRKSVV